MRNLAAALIATVLVGCAHNYQVKSIQRPDPLSPGASALVAVPPDGRYEETVYASSGRRTAVAVAAAFGKHLPKVDIMAGPATPEEQLQAARNGGFDYLVSPMITHWEDRATEWSGKRDKIEVEIQTTRVSDGQQLARGAIGGRSRWGTFGGDSPEDMLENPIISYVDWLFSPPGTELPDLSKPKK